MRRSNPLLIAALSWPLLAITAIGLQAEPQAGQRTAPPSAPTTERSIEAATGAEREHWYRITLDGTPAGSLHVREHRQGEDLVFEMETRLRFRRGTTSVAMENRGRFVEGPDGVPKSMWSRLELADQPIETFYRFSGDEVEVTTKQAGVEKTLTMPRPEGEWVSPTQADRLARRYEAEGATGYTLITIDPTQGAQPIEITRELVARDLPVGLEVEGAPQKATRWRETQSSMPGIVATIDLGPDGTMVRSTTFVMGMSMTIELVNPEDLDESIEDAPEIVASSMIHPNRSLPSARQRRRVVYRLYPLAEPPSQLTELPLPPTAGAQRSERRDNAVMITVDVPSKAARARRGDRRVEAENHAELDRYLRSSPFLDHEVEGIRRLVEVAVSQMKKKNARSSSARAERMRRFVYGYLDQKDLGTGFASATEVAETRTGDCTEHSVLLAALLRADEIPSRVVAGLVYVDEFVGETGVFGYHMWVQAMLDGRWVDLDPSFPGPFDAGHIALGTSALETANLAATGLETLTALFGAIGIDIVEVDS